MSVELDLLVSQGMYLREGEIEPGVEAKVVRLEPNLLDWKRDVGDRVGEELCMPTKEDMAANMIQVKRIFLGYWCKGEKCVNSCTHWVLHSSETICWDCRHNPCACLPPLLWDEAEQADYRFFFHAMVKQRLTSVY
jgi:hypothetical protein